MALNPTAHAAVEGGDLAMADHRLRKVMQVFVLTVVTFCLVPPVIIIEASVSPTGLPTFIEHKLLDLAAANSDLLVKLVALAVTAAPFFLVRTCYRLTKKHLNYVGLLSLIISLGGIFLCVVASTSINHQNIDEGIRSIVSMIIGHCFSLYLFFLATLSGFSAYSKNKLKY